MIGYKESGLKTMPLHLSILADIHMHVHLLIMVKLLLLQVRFFLKFLLKSKVFQMMYRYPLV